MKGQHQYKLTVTWTGNKGKGTSDYNSYDRSHVISAEHKTGIFGSSDPSFKGDKTKYNPEELLVASLSTCHMLWFLHLCSSAGVVVTNYIDHASGTMVENPDGGGYFKEVTLYPEVTVTDEAMISTANSLHHQANKMCFIANSCNFPVNHQPTCSATSVPT
ncbi:MAG TPA: OsmC family protein [Chitinophagaceae bacterium]|nr:OsmC family protein [Chitinophagaceae bacterium]